MVRYSQPGRAEGCGLTSHLQTRGGLYAVFGIYTVLLSVMFNSPFQYLWTQWQLGDLSYGMLVPLVVLYLIWDQRDSLKNKPVSFDFRGILLVVAGIFLFWLGELGGEYTSLFLSFWCLCVGLLLLHLGWQQIKQMSFALLMLLAMFPLPSIIMGRLSLKLKLISSQVGVQLLHWYGMPAFRQGNVIDLGFTQLQVVDACSGLRYLFPIIITGLLLGYFFRLRYWKWALLVVLTVPVIILNNGLRIAATGVLFEIFGPVVAEGFFHDFAGWFTFMMAFFLLLPFVFLLRRGSKRRINLVSERDKASTAIKTPSLAAVALVVLLLGGSVAASQGIEFRERIPLKKSLNLFPSVVEQWQGQHQYLDSIFIDALDFSDYTMIDYRDNDKNLINFYVAYYESQRKGESIHSPSSCLPGGGWKLKDSRVLELDIPKRDNPVRLMRAEMQLGEQRQLTYYWFQQRGRYLTRAYELKLYGFWDALTKKRTDGALVRLIGNIRPGETVTEAEQRLQQFTRRVIPLLDEYIPGAEG